MTIDKRGGRVDRAVLEEITFYRVVDLGFDNRRWVRTDRGGKPIGGFATLAEVGGIAAAQHPFDTALEVKTRVVAKVVKRSTGAT